MKPNKKTIKLSILILACLVVAAASFYFEHQKSQIAQFDPEGKTYFQLVTDKDRQPLPVPPSAIENGRTITLPILMYHHVGSLPQVADKTQADLTVPTANFASQVKWLSDNGYKSITLKDLYLFSLGKFTIPKKPVVFTFDDGYQDVFTNAIPILKQFGYTGSFGIITQKPGTVAGNNTYASWEVIAQAYLNGQEIVSHTQNHFDGSNPKFTADYIYQNLSGSVMDIKKNLGFTTNILIYPYGHYTDTYIEQAKKAGFIMGITVHEGNEINLDNLFELPRVRVHGAETLEEFEKSILE